jgi:hypothetical protein
LTAIREPRTVNRELRSANCELRSANCDLRSAISTGVFGFFPILRGENGLMAGSTRLGYSVRMGIETALILLGLFVFATIARSLVRGHR